MVTLKSHGHKYGYPEANFKFDVSFLRNPWREQSIREEKDAIKRRQMILEFMEDQPEFKDMIERISSIIRGVYLWHPEENNVYAICCSAGEYRSPAVVDLLSEKLELWGIPHEVVHSNQSKL